MSEETPRDDEVIDQEEPLADSDVTETEPAPQPATPEQIEAAENLIRQARLAKMRNQSTVADKLMHEASEIAGNSAVVLEAIGDDYLERRQFRRAKEYYAKAVKLDPENAALENKYGEMVLKVDLHIDPFSMAEADSGTMASGKAAVLLSFFVPGLGQLVLSKWAKGGAMLGGWLLGLVGLLTMKDGIKGLLTIFGSVAGVDIKPISLVYLALMFFCWLWAVGDAASSSKRMVPKKVDRPTPPADFDF